MVVKGYEGLWWVMMGYAGLWWVMMGYDGLWNAKMRKCGKKNEIARKKLKSYEELWRVMKSYDGSLKGYEGLLWVMKGCVVVEKDAIHTNIRRELSKFAQDPAYSIKREYSDQFQGFPFTLPPIRFSWREWVRFYTLMLVCTCWKLIAVLDLTSRPRKVFLQVFFRQPDRITWIATHSQNISRKLCEESKSLLTSR